MAEASIDGMALFDDATAGGAFRLSEPAPQGATEIIGGWTIELRAGSEIVLARSDGPASYEDARDGALSAANQALDFLCLRGTSASADPTCRNRTHRLVVRGLAISH